MPSGKKKRIVSEPKPDYNMDRALELGYKADTTGHWPSIDNETGEWLKSKQHHTRGMELMEYLLNPELNKELQLIENEKGNMQYIPRVKTEFAMGGKVKKKRYPAYAAGGAVPVEVEGQEVAETPGGQIMQFTGPSHEAGGIPVALPAGTEVFSDRISVDGKTMAERKKARDRKLNRLSKILEPDLTNKINRNTAARTKMAMDAEEQMDMHIQEMAAPLLKGNKKIKMAGGGIIAGASSTIPAEPEVAGGSAMPWGQLLQGLIQIGSQLAQGSQEGTVKDPLIAETAGLRPYAGGGTVLRMPATKLEDETLPVAINNLAWNPDELMAMVEQYPELDEAEAFKLNTNLKARTGVGVAEDPNGDEGSVGTTLGNMVGQVGTAVNAIGPLATTLANRRGDTPNINPFLNFGKAALESNTAEMDYLAAQKQEAGARAKIAGNTAKIANRNSAQSINTQRALDSVADLNTGLVGAGIESDAAKQMIQILTQRAALQNQQEGAVMEGEGRRDLLDRKDRDAYFTNLNRDIGNIGTSLQMEGRTLNQQQLNEDELALVGELSKYGFGYTRTKGGKLKLTKVKK